MTDRWLQAVQKTNRGERERFVNSVPHQRHREGPDGRMDDRRTRLTSIHPSVFSSNLLTILYFSLLFLSYMLLTITNQHSRPSDLENANNIQIHFWGEKGFLHACGSSCFSRPIHTRISIHQLFFVWFLFFERKKIPMQRKRERERSHTFCRRCCSKITRGKRKENRH